MANVSDTAKVRIGRVVFKNGPILLRFPDPSEARRKALLARIASMLDAHGNDIDGFAFMVWSRDLASTVDMVGGAHMPSIAVPDFVRNRLLAYKIEGWTLDTIKGRGS